MSAARVLPTCGVLCNPSDKVYRNTWCNVGTQRTRRCTKDTFWNPCHIWREKRVSPVYYMDWERTRFQSFLVTSWVGDTPMPLWRHMTSRHVGQLEWYITVACRQVIRIKTWVDLEVVAVEELWKTWRWVDLLSCCMLWERVVAETHLCCVSDVFAVGKEVEEIE